jgi:hypothetical protein
MFGDVAIQLLGLMGRRDTVPSAMDPEDIPEALNRLRERLAKHEFTNAERKPAAEEDDAEPPVSLDTRAGPLIELLEAALQEDVAVMWERG